MLLGKILVFFLEFCFFFGKLRFFPGASCQSNDSDRGDSDSKESYSTVKPTFRFLGKRSTGFLRCFDLLRLFVFVFHTTLPRTSLRHCRWSIWPGLPLS